MSKRKRSPEQSWCDGVVSLAEKLRGSREDIAKALLFAVFFRIAESRGLMPPFEGCYRDLAACGGDVSMLPALTPPFTEIPMDAEGKYHVDILGRLHELLMGDQKQRKQGSHYTPREMAAEIVRHTLDPLVLTAFERTGDHVHFNGKLVEGPTAAQIASLKACDPAMGCGAFLVEIIRYLGDALYAACQREGKTLSLHDCRIAVAVRCVYGVDKDSLACQLAQCVVWLFLEEPTLSRYALLHALRTGDALVGLDSEQLCAFHWDKGQPPIPEIVQHVTSGVHAAYEIRKTFRTHKLTDDTALELDEQLELVLDDIRVIGNLCVGAFFDHDKPKARETERKRRLALVLGWLRSDSELPDELDTLQNAMTAKHVPFHWPFEFPEAFLWGSASLTPQPTEQPLVVSADTRAVQAVQNDRGQMGWAL